jgi:hypothetical protein
MSVGTLTVPKTSAQQRKRPTRYLLNHRRWPLWVHLQGLWGIKRRMKKKTSPSLMRRRRGRFLPKKRQGKGGCENG